MTDTEKALVEETLLEPTAPHGGALPPHLLANRPFLWLVASTGLSNLSFWCYFSVVWAQASYRLHASAADMSILLGAFSLPFIMLVPLQGMVVDRWSPKWMNVLGLLVWVTAIPVAWAAHSLVLLDVSSLITGIGVAAIPVTRSALIGLMVEERRLVQANGQISAAIQSALIAGPLAAAFLFRAQGAGVVYAASLVVAALSVAFALAVPDLRHGGTRPSFRLADLGRGFLTSWRLAELRMLLALYGVGWLVVNVLWTLEPLFLKHTMHLRSDAIQFMWAGHGAGALSGAIFMSRSRKGPGRELALIGLGLALNGVALVVYIATATFPVALAATAIGGIGFSFFLVSALALVQRVAGEEEWGRVTSVFAILQEGTALVASAVIVGLGSLVVVRPALLVCGVVMGAVGLLGLAALPRLETRRSTVPVDVHVG